MRRSDEIPRVVTGARPLRPIIRERWRSPRILDAVPIIKDIIRGRTSEVSGELIKSIERRFCRLTGAKHAIAMNSGTAALHSAYWALGLGAGDEVLVPGYTFFATATPLVQLGAVPVFCEIDPDTLTIDPVDVARRITPRTKAICVVHTWGNPANMDALCDLAARHGLSLVEDCSHAHGATYRGRAIGSFGDVACFSLQSSKAVAAGEGGIAVTNSDLLYDRMLVLAHPGRTRDALLTGTYAIGPLSYGLKYRPHRFALHLAAKSFDRLGRLNQLRRKNFQLLAEELGKTGVLLPAASNAEVERGGFVQFPFRFQSSKCGGWTREAFVLALRAEGVPLQVDYYTDLDRGLPLYFHSRVFADPRGVGNATQGLSRLPVCALPVTESICSTLVLFPPFTLIANDAVARIRRAVEKVRDYASQNCDLRVDR